MEAPRDTHRDIPTLTILVPLFVAAVVGVVLHLRVRRATTAPRVFLGLVAAFYGAAVVYEAFLPFTVVLGLARNALAPWPGFIQLVPLVSLKVDPAGIILNIALFVPLGLLVPLVTPQCGASGAPPLGALR